MAPPLKRRFEPRPPSTLPPMLKTYNVLTSAQLDELILQKLEDLRDGTMGQFYKDLDVLW